MNWSELVENNKYSTWDEVVEGSDVITAEQRECVQKLGFYNFPVRVEDAAMLEAGTTRPASFAVIYAGIDGNSETIFETAEKALTHIKDRAEWWSSSIAGHNSYAHFYLSGCEFADWKAHRA